MRRRRSTACPSTLGWYARLRPPCNPGSADLLSARCAPATTSWAGPANPLKPPRIPHASETQRQHAHIQHPTPIDLAINLPVSAIEVVAGDRADTVVTVSATNPAKAVDCRGAEETKVDFDGERLTITGPKPRMSWIGPTESVDLKIKLRTGSRLTAEISVGGLRTIGALGATRIRNSMGLVDIDTTGDLWLSAGRGNATVGTAGGGIEITVDHGQIRVGTVIGDALLKALHGSIAVGESGDDLDMKLSYGDLEIARALASVSAKTAYAASSCARFRTGPCRSRAASARSPLASSPLFRPGLTCRS